MDELSAARLFAVAIQQLRAGELFDALVDGGAATVSPEGELIILSGDVFNKWYEGTTCET